MVTAEISYRPVVYNDIVGWADDDHSQALAAYARSHPAFMSTIVPHLAQADADALSVALAAALKHPDTARAFFERYFEPYRIIDPAAVGRVTGYYEPVIEASRSRTGDFQYPIYYRPPDLVSCFPDQLRGARNGEFTHMRKTGQELTPFATRRQIDEGALEGQGLELAYVRDPIDLFFMHIQGSGLVQYTDGSRRRITYDAKNGHPYTSIGRHLISQGVFEADALTLDVLIAWLKSDLDRARQTMWVNASYIFFKELPITATAPQGAGDIPLTPGRSLAVDAGYHVLGTPVFLSVPDLTTFGASHGVNRLMIAQDVGSAIQGAQRGDIFYGSGDEAGRLAGMTNHETRFTILRPRRRQSSNQ